MSTRSVSPQPAFSLRSKYVVFGFIFLMMAYVLNHNERFLVDSTDAVWEHYQPFKWWLLPHRDGGGMCAAAWSDAVFRPAAPPLHEAAPRRGKDIRGGRTDRSAARRFDSYRFSTSGWAIPARSRSPRWWMPRLTVTTAIVNRAARQNPAAPAVDDACSYAVVCASGSAWSSGLGDGRQQCDNRKNHLGLRGAVPTIRGHCDPVAGFATGAGDGEGYSGGACLERRREVVQFLNAKHSYIAHTILKPRVRLA